MKTFQYTVSGFIPFDTREVQAGDQLDFPITSEIAGVPDTIRTVVLSVVDAIVGEVAGHTYDIQYDETRLGGNLLALDPCCDVGMPTAVTTEVVLEEHIANAPFIISAQSDPDALPSVRVTSAREEILPNQDTHIFTINVGDMLTNDLLVADPNEWEFSLEATLTTSLDEVGDGNNSMWKHSMVGHILDGVTLAELTNQLAPDIFVSASEVSGELQILVRNDSATISQFAMLNATLTAFKR